MQTLKTVKMVPLQILRQFKELDSNDLTVMTPKMFEGLDSLKELYFIENGLTSIEPGTFEHLAKLTRLYLYSNHLVTLNEDIYLGKCNWVILNISLVKTHLFIYF